MTEIIYLSHTPILYDLDNDRQDAKKISISDGYSVTSIQDKANLITYLCSKCGLLL